MHQATAFAIASELCRKLPIARNFRSEDIFCFHSQKHSNSLAHSFATLNSSFLLEIWWLKFASEFSGRSKIAFAFATVSLRPPCTQLRRTEGRMSQLDLERGSLQPLLTFPTHVRRVENQRFNLSQIRESLRFSFGGWAAEVGG